MTATFGLRQAILALAATGAIALPATAGTLDDVRARGKVVCGVSDGLPGFSTRSPDGDWSGFDVDICHAVAAAALGDPGAVDYVPLSAAARFDALKSGKIDVLSRNSTWTMSRDLGGLEFAGIAYYDGQGFMAHVVDGMTSALQLDGARVCVVNGTTTEENAAAWFAANNLTVSFVRFTSRPEARMAFASNDCDVFTADASALAAERSILPDPDDYVILPEIISKEPLGPVTRDGDPTWTALVRWTLYGLINAEELDITDESAAGNPDQVAALGKAAVAPLGLEADWLAVMIESVGNYGQIFDRNLGEGSPLGIRRGVNALWTEGGILYAPPLL